jgi:hypothetical protein
MLFLDISDREQWKFHINICKNEILMIIIREHKAGCNHYLLVYRALKIELMQLMQGLALTQPLPVVTALQRARLSLTQRQW